MHSWQYEPGDVLLIIHKGVEQVARVAGYDDSLDNTTPLYVNLRVSGGLRWGERMVKVQPEQIRGEDQEWYARQEAQWQVSIKRAPDEQVAYESLPASESDVCKVLGEPQEESVG